MKKFVLIGALLTTKLLVAQAPEYDDLRIVFADGDYEKLVRVSEKYVMNDKTKADALPHMWMARGLYKVSLSGTDNEKYQNAYKEAISEIGKSIKYDKSGDVQLEYAEFYDEFRNSLVEMIRNEIEAPDYKKAATWVMKYYKINLTSIGAKYLDGVCKFRNADKGGANTLWKECEKLLSAVPDIDNWNQAEKNMLMMGIMQTADCYIAGKQMDKAKALMGKVAQWYEKNEDFKAKYDQIVN
ncbi:hypothetical protein [Fluviicola taffensis]|uniref:Uncharacterized protein n=1 Tax=Fluviicola taffensis (strain DSM 16823 / NCIMB 13979 / RW262) TaxID=755732 RepID=F2IBB0_FLUTR|nr:hypothetical protein [Fluviicola taffensis]AEA43196.1 hypothetical protein Fluta_1201 [Fluviicola taffensis DSM 16823]